MSEMEAYSHERKRMVDKQMVRRGIRDERVLEAMLAIPRHEFVPPEQVHQAYVDAPLPIGNSQTISQPYIVALMTELLYLKGDETVLEIGTGSGYQAAILAHLAKKVYSIERIPELAERAQSLLHSLQLENIEVVVGDGSCGLPEHAPYQAIIVTASAPEVPKPLEDQLSDGGRLVVPVGSRVGQVLELWRREGQKLVCEKLAPVAFVPLIGEHAWSHE
ncbi:MAG: protein-L-isoaspartate(D-aspartate) O-methyltransferase [Anaerolineales bacterium]|nr:MAG: protein-L-isoaspartate(D-aspartate) O-methyltransferase [Anaerolineales bacterium]